MEPFMRTGVVGFNIRPKKALMCDSNPHLIKFYNGIKSKEITSAKVKKFLTDEGVKLLKSDGAYYYDAIEGDPLDLGGNHSSLSAQDAFELSIDSDYPDSLFQICQLMKSKRAGDILVCAADGHDLRDFWEYPEHKGSHGSLHKDHMLMPILTNQKDLIPHPVRSNRIHQVIKEWLV